VFLQLENKSTNKLRKTKTTQSERTTNNRKEVKQNLSPAACLDLADNDGLSKKRMKICDIDCTNSVRHNVLVPTCTIFT
jgi:cell division protein FtsL